MLDNRVYCRCAVVIFGNIASDTDSVAAVGSDSLCLTENVSLGAAEHCNAPALFCKLLCACKTDSLACSGDDDNFLFHDIFLLIDFSQFIFVLLCCLFADNACAGGAYNADDNAGDERNKTRAGRVDYH